MKTASNRAFTAKKKFFLLAMTAVTLGMTSCKEAPYIPSPGDPSHNLDSIPVLIADTDGIEISIDSAIAICNGLTENVKTGEIYKITGVITRTITDPHNVGMHGNYSNISFDISNDGGRTFITPYYMNNVNNRLFRSSAEVPRFGSKVTVLGVLERYVSASGKVTNELTDGFIVRIDSMVGEQPFPGCPEPDTLANEISVSDAVAIASQLISDGKHESNPVSIVGVVTDIFSIDTYNYGSATFLISDGKQYFEVYNAKKGDNIVFTDINQLQVNDTVTVYGPLCNYNGTYETTNKAYITKSTNPNW